MPKLPNCRICGSGAFCWSCRSFQANESLGQSRYRIAISPKSCAWIYWVWQRRGEFLPKCFGFLALFQSTGVCLVARPHLQSPSFHLFRWLKLRATCTQAAHEYWSRKRDRSIAISLWENSDTKLPPGRTALPSVCCCWSPPGLCY